MWCVLCVLEVFSYGVGEKGCGLGVLIRVVVL